MKTNFLRIVTAIMLSIALLCACSKPKDGIDGAKGETGQQGQQGQQGERGERGERGETGATGAQGAQGERGPAGATGAQGPQGIAGNAGVMMYTYGSETFDWATFYEIPITFAEVQKSLIYAYYLDLSFFVELWFPVPGANGTYTSYFNLQFLDDNTIMNIRLYNYDGTEYTTAVTWDAFRIIVVPIPEENIIARSAGLDYSNYKEVAEYYGLPQ